MFFLVRQDSAGNKIDLPLSSHYDIEIDIINELTEHCALEQCKPLNFAAENKYTLYRNDRGIYTAV